MVIQDLVDGDWTVIGGVFTMGGGCPGPSAGIGLWGSTIPQGTATIGISKSPIGPPDFAAFTIAAGTYAGPITAPPLCYLGGDATIPGFISARAHSGTGC